MVLVHGTPLDAAAWSGLVPAVAAQHRVITYDLRGHGSERSVPLPDSYEALADDLAELLDGLAIERGHVVGHSFGGQVAQTFAARYPERLRALTVICSRSTPHPPFAAAADAIESNGIEAVADGALERWFTPAALASGAGAVEYARSRLTPDAAQTLAAAFRLIAAFDIGERLAGLGVPAGFVAAERDAVATPDEMRRAALIPPQASFVLEADVGHMLPVEQPERLAHLAW